jgi:hypothetical protein
LGFELRSDFEISIALADVSVAARRNRDAPKPVGRQRRCRGCTPGYDKKRARESGDALHFPPNEPVENLDDVNEMSEPRSEETIELSIESIYRFIEASEEFLVHDPSQCRVPLHLLGRLATSLLQKSSCAVPLTKGPT